VAEAKKSDEKGRPGRKSPPGDRRQFLAVMNANVIKAIKVAAAEEETTALELLERAARELLERSKTVRARKA
jgi:hypothetical protein